MYLFIYHAMSYSLKWQTNEMVRIDIIIAFYVFSYKLHKYINTVSINSHTKYVKLYTITNSVEATYYSS